jgi:regulator of replication initiation timing
MTDIVERLRAEIEGAQHPIDKVMAEAADEIERLRNEHIELRGRMADCIRVDNENLRAENERLRKQLDETDRLLRLYEAKA